MNKFACIAAATIVALSATTAQAQSYLEVRGGIAGTSETTTETIGLAAGFDTDVGSSAFVGAEITADTDASFSTPVYGLNARVGTKMGEDGKLFATAGVARLQDSGYIYGLGYFVAYSGWYTDFTAGAGYQHKIGKSTRLSIQYQRYFDTQANRGSIGIGFEF
jgi:outer membrane immunogenic protein